MNTLASFLTPLIALVTVYIAYIQYGIQRNKVRLDLYEKRFKIFELTRNIILLTIKADKVTGQDFLIKLSEFSGATVDRHFLFDNDVNDFISKLREDLIQINMIEDDVNNQDLKSRKNKILLDYQDKLDNLHAVFSPYLSFKQL